MKQNYAFLLLVLFVASSLTYNNPVIAIQSIETKQNLDSRPNLGGKKLHVAMVWHQHQPSYLDPTTGYYEQPWVFMHGINDYPKMLDLLAAQPTVKESMDMTGTLLTQLVDYAAGTAKDRLIEMALKDNTQLTDDEKYFLFGPYPGGNLFDINGQFIVNKFKTVNDARSSYMNWTNNMMYTAKTLFFLQWMNREYVDGNTSLAALKAKNVGFDVDVNPYTQTDVNYTIAAGYNILRRTIPLAKSLMTNGQLELVSTPLAHPIGPLLLDTRSELQTSVGKSTKMPVNNTGWGDDLRAQIKLSNDLFFNQFGQYPTGVWSPEQAVSPALIPYYNEANFSWSITAPEQLAKVPGKSSAETDLNQLYKVDDGAGNSMFFVYDDTELSDAVGFDYAKLSNQTEASEDFLDVLYRKYQSFKDEAGDPRLVTMGLDGENAWEWYPDNGIQFRTELYAALAQAQAEGWLVTTSVNDYINTYGVNHPTADHTLKYGSWINGDFTTWIGEDLENRYWDELIDARRYLVSVNSTLNSTARDAAWNSVYLAEGSDWFWWAGADQDSGNDEKFDWAFKSLLRSIYFWSGFDDANLLAAKPFLYEQLKPLSSFERNPSSEVDITVEGGLTTVDEWDAAGLLSDVDGGVFETGNDPNNIIGKIYLGYGAPDTYYYVRIDLSSYLTMDTWNYGFLAVYMTGDGSVATNIRTRYGNATTLSTGFPIAYEIGVNFTELVNGTATDVPVFAANGDETWSITSNNATVAFADFLEIAIPVAAVNAGPESIRQFAFEAASSNTSLNAMIQRDLAPNDGPISLTLPPAGVSGDLIFSHIDPEGDETGSAGPVGSAGGLEYGTNAAFDPYKGLFDLTTFKVYHDANKLETIFEVGIKTITNPWGSPYGLSHPGILIYIDQDRIPGSGGRAGIENSQANIDEFSAYEWAMQAGGWEGSWSFYEPTVDEDGNPLRTGATPGVNMRMVVDPNAGFVRISVTDDAIGFTVDNTMGFIVASVSNDGFSPNNIRTTGQAAQEYALGGQSDSLADPNVIDALTPTAIDQLAMLSNYKESPPTNPELTAVGLDANGDPITGIYDFAAPVVKTMSFNGGTAKDVKTNTPDGAIINASFTYEDISPLGGVWVYNSAGKLIGVSSKEKAYVEFFLPEGTHDIEVRIADSIGNIGVETYTIVVSDGYAPTIVSISTSPDPLKPVDWLTVSAVVTDTHLQSVTAEYSTDGGSTWSSAAMSEDSSVEDGWSTLVAKFSEGEVKIRVSALDEAGNTRVSDILSVSVVAAQTTTTEEEPYPLLGMLFLVTIPMLRRRKR